MDASIQPTDAAASRSIFGSLFGRSANPQTEPPASVLAEWNRYSTQASGPAQSDRLLAQIEEGSASMQNYLSSSFTRVADGVKGLPSSVNTSVGSFHVPSTMQLAYFAALLAGGLGFLALAFSVFLPVIIISPSKFAICFTIGSMLILVAFASLRGYRNQLTHMFSKDRLLFTSVYLGSMAGTLYAAVSLHSYVLSLVFCAIQVFALLYYTMSYFPGGIYGLKYILYSIQSALMKCFLAVVQR